MAGKSHSNNQFRTSTTPNAGTARKRGRPPATEPLTVREMRADQAARDPRFDEIEALLAEDRAQALQRIARARRKAAGHP